MPSKQMETISNNITLMLSMSKKEKILRYLESGGTLTVAKALALFGCYALSQRIGNLIREGYPIVKETVISKGGVRITEYSLERKEAP